MGGAGAVEHADVGAVDFVPGKAVEVDAEGFDVDAAVLGVERLVGRFGVGREGVG